MPQSGTDPEHGRIPSLDGWRACCIALVLVRHTDFTYDFPQKYQRLFYWVFDAPMAVRFFFVLSGFLITTLLLEEHQRRGRISLTDFYVRRSFRILPIYYAFLIAVGALELFTAARRPPEAWAANLTFTSNYCEAVRYTGHLWSLAIEEQFYLIWPPILVWAGAGNPARVLKLLLVPIALGPALKLIDVTGYWVFLPEWCKSFMELHSSFIFFDCLAVGCVMAIIYTRHRQEVMSVLNRHTPAVVAAALALILIPYYFDALNSWGLFVLATRNLFQSAGFGALVFLSIFKPQWFKPLNWPLVRWLGVLSYSIYVWQNLFCVDPAAEYGLPRFWFVSMWFWIPTALVVAVISYYCLERPFLRLRARHRP